MKAQLKLNQNTISQIKFTKPLVSDWHRNFVVLHEKATSSVAMDGGF